MAGIGFRLRALTTGGSYLEASAAYLSSAVISTGPWLSGAAALLVLHMTTRIYLTQDDRAFLFATLISLFACSLLAAGGPQMLLTRYLADCLYTARTACFAPTCTGVLVLSVPLALLSVPFLLYAPFSWPYRLLAATLFLTLTMIWLVTTFLSAARSYLRIVLIYVCSSVCGAVASLLLGLCEGVQGSLAGFTFGEILCLALLLESVYREFPSSHVVSWAYIGYLRRFWDLWLSGVLYVWGVWIDSLLFWISAHGQVIHSFYRLFAPYDTSRFAVSLSSVAATAIFLLRLETDFFEQYQRFYQAICHGGTLADLTRAREGMVAAVRAAVLTLLKVQGLIALFFCVIARDLVAWLGLAPRWSLLLRIQACAGPGQFMLFVMLLFLLYLDRRRTVLLLVALFLLGNAGLTLLSLALGEAFYGTGYLLASWAGAVLGWLLLCAHLKKLEYRTFMAQPVS
ncbi:MAG TPA: exopolysaccharide Pel transporter PelG [Ktedonobacteraceae bacterium]|jgi:uncharacterized membrane protein